MADLAHIDSLRPHPLNARRGDIDMICDSLRHHGQYAPIIVNADGTILAGHHVVKAARRLGWTEVAVRWVDYDEATAARVLAADNHLSDLATYDTGALVGLLAGLPDLDGTGFTADDLTGLVKDTAPAPLDADEGGEPRAAAEPDPMHTRVKVGRHRFDVEADPFQAWHLALLEEAGGSKPARKVVRARLAIPEPAKPARHDPADTPSPPASVHVETVPIDDLIPMPGNARQGDIGAITESLRAFGQYRPLVITADNVIIKGNHTARAIKALGWANAEVVRLIVDDVTARKIALVDNRTADVSGYDDDALRRLISQLSSSAGTGYDAEDVNDLLSGGPARASRAGRSQAVEIGDVTFRVARPIYATWAADLPPGMECVEIARRLDLPIETCIFGS